MQKVRKFSKYSKTWHLFMRQHVNLVMFTQLWVKLSKKGWITAEHQVIIRKICRSEKVFK